MSKPVKPGWPDTAALPFNLFGTAPTTQPLTQGLAGGMDMIRKFWGSLPGGAALPGFMVPTIDVEELDKRIKDLRAAESWVEVNLNMLRATIQGLEVQRNTIAAIQSISAMAEGALTAQPAAPAPTSAAGSAAPPATSPATSPSTSTLPAGWPASPAPSATAAPAAPPPAEPPAAAVAPAAADKPAGEGDPAGGLLAGLAANHWLGFMQDQFAKVAQAALSTPAALSGRSADVPAAGQPSARRKAAKPAAKKARRRTPAARKAPVS